MHDIAIINCKSFYFEINYYPLFRLVELLLNGVVERFNPSVQTQKLSKIKFSDEIVQLVTEGMTKTSTYVHDESYAIGRLIPSNDEMIEDLNNLERFSKLFK